MSDNFTQIRTHMRDLQNSLEQGLLSAEVINHENAMLKDRIAAFEAFVGVLADHLGAPREPHKTLEDQVLALAWRLRNG